MRPEWDERDAARGRRPPLTGRARVADQIAVQEGALAALQAYVSGVGAGLDAEAALHLAEACEEIANRYMDASEGLLAQAFPPGMSLEERAEIVERLKPG